MTPRTEAGQSLLNAIHADWAAGRIGEAFLTNLYDKWVAAIEAEAIHADRERLIAAVEELNAIDGYPGPRVEKTAVLDLLRKDPDHAD